jgi:hypothetical protein
MKKLKRREPILAPGGLGRLIQIIAVMIIANLITRFMISPLVGIPVKAAFEAAGIVEPHNSQQSRP